MRIAIVGSGIAGLSAAWLFHKEHEVKLFEKDNRFGGHAHTVDVKKDEDTEPVAVDSGFIVYNELNYPNLIGLFDALNIKTQKTEMSFGLSLSNRQFEYAGSLKGLFAQPLNWLKPKYWLLLSNLYRFYKTAANQVELGPTDETLQELMIRMRMSDTFIYEHMLPMAAAIWSCPSDVIMQFPARSFIKFMDNHKLLDFSGRPIWRTVSGGSRNYVAKIIKMLGQNARCNVSINKVERTQQGVIISIEGEKSEFFDKIIFATHANDTLELLHDIKQEEYDILSQFSFQKNNVILHSQSSYMPKKKMAWSSWNYLSNNSEKKELCVTYWMNKLQSISNHFPLFVTLNPFSDFPIKEPHRHFTYLHPIFDQNAIEAQKKLNTIQGPLHTYFCGAWTRYGFHEDGILSAVAIAKAFNIEIPWFSPTEACHAPNWLDIWEKKAAENAET